IGIILAALGIQLIISSYIGVDSISTLILGLMNFTPFSFGTWSQIISFTLLLITFFVHKEKIGIASLIYVFLLGGTLNIISPLFINIKFTFFSFPLCLLGFILYGIGIALYLSVNLGAGPIEGIMYIFIKITKLPIYKARIILDILFNLIGYILGGPIGIGTLFGIFCVGYLIDFFIKQFELLFKKLL
ncbi:MAG: YczE/YyaS/YitT family protein, partial [Lactovum sp.]